LARTLRNRLLPEKSHLHQKSGYFARKKSIKTGLWFRVYGLGVKIIEHMGGEVGVAGGGGITGSY
jgi:hypothetical protein